MISESKIKTIALETIEGLCLASGDEEWPLGEIYMIAHTANNKKCRSNHEDWLDKMFEIQRNLKDNGVI